MKRIPSKGNSKGKGLKEHTISEDAKKPRLSGEQWWGTRDGMK